MKYKFAMLDSENTIHDYYYDTTNNTIITSFGHSVVKSKQNMKLNKIHHISPENPGKKTNNIKVLKIQLGLKCNYSCSYCLQASQIENSTDTNNADAETFISNIDNWLHSVPKKIEFWGGEPFVYWNKLKILIPKLREKFPKTEFLIITNGSLLDEEKVLFIDRYDIMVGISHDGPQQKFRGPDPFKKEIVYNAVKQLRELRPNKVSFNIVIHSKNYNFDEIYNWFNDRFPNCNLSLEGIVAIYDDYTLKNIGQFSKKQYEDLVDKIFLELVQHKTRFNSLSMKLQSFINTINRSPPSSRATFDNDFLHSVGQKCGMDREDYISVDLLGNATTCQNTGSKDEHKIGHVDKFQDIKLNTSTHFIHREECMHCPLVHLCKGSCMYLYNDNFTQSCWNEYYFNLGILKAAMFTLTGKLLVGIEGDIRRPEYSPEMLLKFPQLLELYKS